MIKSSFTMIELIFVIVILGILAAVAIPKLVATRTDAETAKLMSQARDGMREFISYYTATGEDINFSKMESQIVFNELIKHKWVYVIDDNHSVFYSSRDTNTVCLNYKTNGVEVEVDVNKSDTDTLCTSFKKIIKDRNYSILNSVVTF